MIAPGRRVRVRNDWPETRGPCHIRTPHYLRGATGTVLRHLGDFPNPEDLAFGRAAERLPLYHVAFDAASLWGDGRPEAEILVEIYAPWLEPL
jgi:nitrile hydratase